MKMRMISLAVSASVLLTVPIVNAGEKSYDELIQESERLWMEHKFDASDRLLGEAVKIHPDLTEAYWRKARNEYERLEDMPRDKIDKEHARVLLEDPSIACGYQRDAQQEWSREGYEKNR